MLIALISVSSDGEKWGVRSEEWEVRSEKWSGGERIDYKWWQVSIDGEKWGQGKNLTTAKYGVSNNAI